MRSSRRSSDDRGARRGIEEARRKERSTGTARSDAPGAFGASDAVGVGREGYSSPSSASGACVPSTPASAPERSIAVRSPFTGVLQTFLAMEGERVTARQPVAWLRTA